MKLTWNQQLIKRENKSIVLKYIQDCSPLSRADIAQKSGLNKGTVSSLVAELLEEQLILEKGPGVSSGGRRPVMLSFNQGAGYSIGIDLGVNYILGVLTDLQGNIIEKVQQNYYASTFEQALECIKEIITYLIEKTSPSTYNIVGIGIGAPGVVNIDGDFLLAPNLGWQNPSLKQGIEQAFNIPVIVENEANAGAYGEKIFGLGKDENHLVYISAGIGIGTGMIMNGELYRGEKGYSGEFGHMSINFNGEKCRCGNKGCWELYASEQAIVKNAEESSLEYMIILANKGDQYAIQVFNQTAAFLGVGIVNIIHALNPQQIIIGNRLSAAKPWMEQQVQDYVNEYAMPSHTQEIKVLFSSPDFPSTALGVSAFSVENFLRASLMA